MDKLEGRELCYRAIIENATDAICIIDAALNIVDISSSGCYMLGYPREEFLLLSVADLFIQNDMVSNRVEINKLIPGKIVRSEQKLRRKDGAIIDVEMSGKMLEDGSFIVFGHEISGHQKAEQLISKTEARFRAFFDNSMDGILLTVTDGEILAANPAACEIFGMTEEEICSAGRYGLVDETDPRLNVLIAERQRHGYVKGELTYIRKDGSRFTGESSSILYTDASGQERTSMIIRDVSDTKKLEQALKAEQQRFAGLYLHSPSYMGILKGPNHVFKPPVPGTCN